MNLSVAILTFNSQKYLKEVLKSASFADEIVVIDSGSNDDTIKICKDTKAKVIYQKWLGFGKQKQFAVDNCKNRWVFVLDSDEVITDELKNEIIDTLENPTKIAYKVARLNYFFGSPIKRMGLYPDCSIRLFDKEQCSFSKDEVHEKVNAPAEKTGQLKHHMLHYAYETIEEFIDKQNRYSSLGAKHNALKALINPAWTFFKLYFLKLGFLEGWRGYVIAKLYAQYTFWKYIK